MQLIQTAGLFILTALAEIVGCFLPYLWLRKDGSIWLLIPAALSLAAFVWLLTLHPAASGRVYAAYGGVYVATALVWLKVVDGEKLSVFDWTGAGIALFGMAVIVFGWTPKSETSDSIPTPVKTCIHFLCVVLSLLVHVFPFPPELDPIVLPTICSVV